jgi:hypothetical protein
MEYPWQFKRRRGQVRPKVCGNRPGIAIFQESGLRVGSGFQLQARFAFILGRVILDHAAAEREIALAYKGSGRVAGSGKQVSHVWPAITKRTPRQPNSDGSRFARTVSRWPGHLSHCSMVRRDAIGADVASVAHQCPASCKAGGLRRSHQLMRTLCPAAERTLKNRRIAHDHDSSALVSSRRQFGRIVVSGLPVHY